MTTMQFTPLTLKVRRLRPDARLPLKAHDTSACFDLFACDPYHSVGGLYQVRTGIAVELPESHFALILGRSSLAAKGITPLGNVVDSDYRGEWIVNLWVPVAQGFIINAGDRVAQFCVLPRPRCVIEEVEELSETVRGSGGFGSTGR